MPKAAMTDSQKWRREAAALIMKNIKNERVLANPWTTIDRMAMYLRYGDPDHEIAPDGRMVAKK